MSEKSLALEKTRKEKPTRSSQESEPTLEEFCLSKLSEALLNSAREPVYAKWYYSPATFARDVIVWPEGESLAPYQLDCMQDVVDYRRVSVRGPHGLGKTAMASILVLWFALTRDLAEVDWKVVTTASAWRQLTHYLWPEIRKWSRRINWDVVGRPPFNERTELMVMSIRLRFGEAFAVASDQPELLEGSHASSMLWVYDEAKSIPDATFDATEGAFSGGGEVFAMSISTPGTPEGRFFQIQSRMTGYEDWHVRHVTLEEAVASGRLPREWAVQRKRQWGENSAVYQNRVLGEFASNSQDGIIPLSWLEQACDRWREWKETTSLGKLTAIGADIGGGGDAADKSVAALVYDMRRIDELRKYEIADQDQATMEVTGYLAGLMEDHRCPAYIDVIGIGSGVVHRLREMGYQAEAFHASKRTEFRDSSGELGFHNWRSAMWWLFREMLDPANNLGIALPPDDELIGELLAPKASITSSGSILVESKQLVRRRMKRSTNCADSVLMAMVGPLLLEEDLRLNSVEVMSFQTELGAY